MNPIPGQAPDIPYSGAAADVNLGSHGLLCEFLRLLGTSTANAFAINADNEGKYVADGPAFQIVPSGPNYEVQIAPLGTAGETIAAWTTAQTVVAQTVAYPGGPTVPPGFCSNGVTSITIDYADSESPVSNQSGFNLITTIGPGDTAGMYDQFISLVNTYPAWSADDSSLIFTEVYGPPGVNSVVPYILAATGGGPLAVPLLQIFDCINAALYFQIGGDGSLQAQSYSILDSSGDLTPGASGTFAAGGHTLTITNGIVTGIS
jgi:hypothetical protein